MSWQETLTKWQEIAQDMLQAALDKFRAKGTEPATTEEKVSQLNVGELLSVQQAVRQDLSSTLNQALTLDALPTGDARFFNRDGLLEQLRAALDAWRAGQPRMIACYGPYGSGISSLLNQVGQLAGQETALHHHVLRQHLNSVEDVLALCGELFDLSQPPAAIDDALKLVREAPARIVIIDNAHYFILRIAGNVPVVRALSMLMVASRDRHLWILGCNKEAWNRLVYVHNIDRYFTDLLPLTLFNGEELAGMLAQRLQWADVHISVEADEDAKTDNSALETVLPGELLMRLSNGHPQLVIALLIKALVPSDDPKRFTLSLPQQLNMKALDALQPTELFALAEIAVHGTLSALEHQTIFRSPMTDSQMLLADLCHRQLLCRQPGQQTGVEAYYLQPMIAPIITAHLYKKNLLY